MLLLVLVASLTLLCVLVVNSLRKSPVSSANFPKFINTNGVSRKAPKLVKQSVGSVQQAAEPIKPGTIIQTVDYTLQGNFTQSAVFYPGSFTSVKRNDGRIGDDESERIKKADELDHVKQCLAETGQTNNYNPTVTERWFELRRLSRSLRDGMTKNEVVQLFGPPTYEHSEGTGITYDPKPGGWPLLSQNYEILGISFNSRGRLLTWAWFDRTIN